MMMQRTESMAGFKSLAYFLAGAAAGGITAMLVTPCSGRQMRRKIQRQAEAGRETVLSGASRLTRRTRSKVNELADRAENLVESSRGLITSQLRHIDSVLANAGKEAARQRVTNGRAQA